MPMASMDLSTINLPPSMIDDLNMRDHGLELIDVDPFYSYIGADGASLLFWRNLDKTCAEIAAFSPVDAKAYRDFTRDMIGFWRTLAPYLHSNPLRPSVGALATMARRGLANLGSITRAARTMMASPAATLDAQFESPVLRAALANFAAGSTAPLDQPGSGLILALMAMQHEWGVARPVGGMGAFADTLAKIGTNHGVVFKTGCGVRAITLRGGRTAGVELEDGERIEARDVIGAVDPKTLMLKLLPAEHLPPAVAADLKGMTVFGSNIASARVDLLLEREPTVQTSPERARMLLPTSMLIGPSRPDQVRNYVAQCARGILEDDIPVWAACPSMLDRTLTPTAEQQGLYVYVPAVPFRLAHGEHWADRRDELGEKVVRRLETVMPDITSIILARSVRTPEDIEGVSGLTGGCMYHADMSLSQMGPWRPVPALAGYKTGVKGLWHCGAGAHPMGSVNGISGKLAAKAVLKG